mmetsp:Transcript_47233/g.127457  ORF Transcript_47233/g.127457 Transcript_47233/m.127457 type:complete len:216 (-) Transcript_47233:2673-3320(-)
MTTLWLFWPICTGAGGSGRGGGGEGGGDGGGRSTRSRRKGATASLHGGQQQQRLVDCKLRHEIGEDREHHVLHGSDPADEEGGATVEHDGPHAVPVKGGAHHELQTAPEAVPRVRANAPQRRFLALWRLWEVLGTVAEPKEAAGVQHIQGDERDNEDVDELGVRRQANPEQNVGDDAAKNQQQGPVLSDGLRDRTTISSHPVADVNAKHPILQEV